MLIIFVTSMNSIIVTNDMVSTKWWTSITDIENANISNVTDMCGMFAGRTELVTLDLSHWDTSNVTNMNGMFWGCRELQTLNINDWNMTNVTTMEKMFKYCDKLTILNANTWNESMVAYILMICSIESCN